MDDQVDRAVDATAQTLSSMFEQAAHEERKRAFEALNPREVSQMDDKKLADWQAGYPKDSAQYISSGA